MGQIENLQRQHRIWLRHNFPDQPAYQPLLGIGEETGELMHAHLKNEQGIRSMNDARFMDFAEDALGDLFIYMMSYANAKGINLEKSILEAWSTVKNRDWVAHPEAGVP